jgi:hypothetical protein
MNSIMRKILLLVICSIVLIYSCQKVDYSEDIESLKQQISLINQRLDSLTNSIKLISGQLNNVESSIKNKIDNTNLRVDSISNAFNTLKNQVNINSSSISVLTKSVNTLTNDINIVNAKVSESDLNFKSKTDALFKSVDSSNKVIRKIDSLLSTSTISNDSLNSKLLTINANYSNILTNYLEILTILRNTTSTFLITGKIEKGPFSQGSIISFFELDSNLSQTGKSYSAIIEDNQGNYDLKATGLAGKMFRLNTDGFYFNEVMNTPSTSRIVLTAISKIDSNENVNVNALTHLERRRVQYLMTEKNYSYDSAKKVAITDLLKVFGHTNNAVTRSEKVNLFGSNEDLLLNISILLQGYRTDAQLTELLTDFGNDFYIDGTINDIAIQKSLYNHGFLLDTISISKNLKSKFNYSTKSFDILKKYINVNVNKFDKEFMPLKYPSIYNGRKNILERIERDTLVEGPPDFYSIIFSNSGVKNLEFKFILKSDSLFNDGSLDGSGVQSNYWNIDIGNSNWTIPNSFQFDNYGNQTFSTTDALPEMRIQFKRGHYTLYFYEPSSSPQPTFVKKIVVNPL